MEFKNFINESVKEYLPQLIQYLKDSPDDLLVHFSNTEKVGINPKPSHNDPVGIYTFPKKYVLSSDFKKNTHFFGKPYIHILKLKSNTNILNLSHLTMREVDDMLEKMGIKEFKDKKHFRDRNNNLPGQILWDTIEKSLENNYKNKNISWNKLFNKAGKFDAIQDDGDAIIHMNEPSQVVILNPNAYVKVREFETEIPKSYKGLAYKIMQQISVQLFGGVRITSTRSGYNKDKVNLRSNGKIDGIDYSLSLEYEENTSGWVTQRTLQYPLRANIFLSHAHDYIKFVLEVSFEETNLEEKIYDIVEKFKYFIKTQEHKEDFTSYENKLFSEIMKIFKFGKSTKDNIFIKIYPQGKFTLRVGYSKYRNEFYCNMLLEKRDSHYNNYSLHANTDVSSEEVIDNVNAAAKRAINSNFIQWQNSIMQWYNPNDKDYFKSKTGRELMQFLDFLKQKSIT